MNRAPEALRGAVSAVRERLSAVTGQSERTTLLGAVLLASVVSAATGFVLAQYYSIDVLSSLIVFPPDDCYLDWPTRVGRHCFSDYSITATIGMVPNPWAPYPLYLPPDFKPDPLQLHGGRDGAATRSSGCWVNGWARRASDCSATCSL